MDIENAAISLETVRIALERCGQTMAVETLRGMEVVNPSGAALALDALQSIEPSTLEVHEALAWAMDACRTASRTFVAAA